MILILNKTLQSLDNMTYRQQYHHNQTYNSIRDDPDKRMYNQIANVQVYRPSNTQLQSTNHHHSAQSKLHHQYSNKKNGFQVQAQKKNQIKNRINQIIGLCKDQNIGVNAQFTGVIGQEKQVLALLQQSTNEQNIQRGLATNQNTYTPIKRQQLVSFKHTQPNRTLTNNINSIIAEYPHVRLNQDAIQLIKQIQRRASSEIEKLKSQNAVLIQNLNEEIRRNNEQKRKNAQLQSELQYYRANGSNQGQSLPPNHINLADLQILYAQGEAIRQQTIRLLKLKQSKLSSGGNNIENQHLKEQNYRLSKRIEQLQVEAQKRGRFGKPSYEVINEQYSPIQYNHKKTNSFRQSAKEYDSLVMQMRKITGN